MNKNLDWIDYVFDEDNIEKAKKQVYANKGSAGIDGVTVFDLDNYIYEHIDEIKGKIYQRKYKPTPVKRVEIPKENGKKRQLGIPTVIDRVIQQAIVQRLSPVFERDFNQNSFGFRPGKYCEEICNDEIIDGVYYYLIDDGCRYESNYRKNLCRI